MISGVHAALSGLQAYSVKTQNNANNIANMQTEGFKKSRVLLAEQRPQGVRATVEKVETQGAQVMEQTAQGSEMIELSNVDLGEEIPEMLMNRHGYSANLKTLQIADEMAESLLDIKA